MTRYADPTSVEEVIVCRDVRLWYGEFEALRGVSLTVKRGDVVVILGPSGSGKSTFIRAMNRLEEHGEGDIIVNGITLNNDVRNVAEIRREVGMVFQQFNLFPHLTVIEWSREKAEETAMKWLTRVGIPEQAGKYPTQLSGGQQQRVAIARTLAMEPEVLLFDEPTSALDPEMVKEVLDVMTDLAKEGYTIIAVTHEMGFARGVADRIVFMDYGEILEQDEPNEFFDSPKNERLKLFLSQILHH
jgi:general L-amino acid transport system ATP-binding protein